MAITETGTPSKTGHHAGVANSHGKNAVPSVRSQFCCLVFLMDDSVTGMGETGCEAYSPYLANPHWPVRVKGTAASVKGQVSGSTAAGCRPRVRAGRRRCAVACGSDPLEELVEQGALRFAVTGRSSTARLRFQSTAALNDRRYLHGMYQSASTGQTDDPTVPSGCSNTTGAGRPGRSSCATRPRASGRATSCRRPTSSPGPCLPSSSSSMPRAVLCIWA